MIQIGTRPLSNDSVMVNAFKVLSDLEDGRWANGVPLLPSKLYGCLSAAGGGGALRLRIRCGGQLLFSAAQRRLQQGVH